MSDVDLKKLKVAELREELKQRGLDSKGNKGQLVKRLQQFIASEAGEEADDVTLDDSALETTTEEQLESDEPDSQTTADVADLEPDFEPVLEPSVEPDFEAADEPVAEEVNEPVLEPVSEPEPQQVKEETEQDALPLEEAMEPEESEINMESVTDTSQEEIQEELTKEIKEEIKQETVVETKEDEVVKEAPEGDTEPPAEGTGDATEGQEDAEDESMPLDGEFQVMDSVGDTDGIVGDDDRRGEKRRRSRSREFERHGRHGRSRSRSPHGKHRSSSRSRHQRRSRSHEHGSKSHDHEHSDRVPRHQEPDEPDDWLELTNVQFDRYNCDLNLRVQENGFKCTPITVEGFAYMWAGARSNYGVNKGKVAFECKIVEELNVDHLGPEENNRHVARVGFSVDSTSTQLGEEPLSYGYGGTGKASTDCKFNDFGETFGVNDVITAYVDFEGEKVEISYAKNGVDLGMCFDIEKDILGEEALFPHILTKNSEFDCNFGEKEEPHFPLKEGFMFINAVPLEERVRGTTPPAKKEDCEIIMMCGLPGSGKTFWSAKHAQENKDKRFNVLGTNTIIDKMKVMGLPRKKNYSGRWDVLIDKSTRCLNRMLEMASKRKRNYILDQTNVYPSAQRRKMRPFEGFQRKAIVLVPTDEEFKSRCEKREKEEGKEVPDSAVLEMKANFALPEEGSLFDKVEFVELEREEAAKLVEKYNKEGRDALPPPEKRYRDNRFSGGRDYNRDNRYSSRGGGYRGGGYGGSRGYDDRRGHDRRGGSYMGYSNNDRRRYDDRDNRRERGARSSNSDSRNSRSYGGSSTWSKSGNNQGSWGNQGNWGNQGSWGSNQGNWGNQGNWNGQNYQGNWGGQQQWGNYNQQPSQNWNQGYNYNWPQSSWSGYNQNQSGSWSGYGSNYGSGSSSSSTYQGHK